MGLDPRTMILVISILCLILAILLGLAGMHAGRIKGVRQWAFANLCISLSFSFAMYQSLPGGSWWVVWGGTLLAAGLSLELVGIQAFKGDKVSANLPLAASVLVFLQTYWFVFINPDIHLRVISNSLVFGLISAVAARYLLVPIKQPLRTAYWLTGAAFAVLALVFFIRLLLALFSPAENFSLYQPNAVNHSSFFMASIMQLVLTFGFVLMLNYRLADELHMLASRDGLTGAFNRRSFQQEAERLLAYCARRGEGLALMMLDVDHFKQINDRFGHTVGDKVLCKLAEVVKETIRAEDHFSRYGGEEFCILLPCTSEAEASILAERLRKNYAETKIEFDGHVIVSTMSIGVTSVGKNESSWEALVAAADWALYQAKENGRNRVEVFAPAMPAMPACSQDVVVASR